jgi:serine/threonine-protein kinase RsbW
MNKKSKKKVEIYIPSELGYEKVAISAAAVVAQKMGFSPDRIEDLKTAVGEAVTNAIEHGNQFNVEVKVLVVLTVEERSLALHVVDEGRKPIPDISLEREIRHDNRGWGMFLIKNLMDEVEVVAQPGRNEIRMVIHLEH